MLLSLLLKWAVFSLGVWCYFGIVGGGRGGALLGGSGAFAISTDNFRESAVEGTDELWGEEVSANVSSSLNVWIILTLVQNMLPKRLGSTRSRTTPVSNGRPSAGLLVDLKKGT